MAPTPQTKFAIETYPGQERQPNLVHAPCRPWRQRQVKNARRKPVLKVPEKVIAPVCIPADLGCHAYRSMHSSPKISERIPSGRNEIVNVIDDIDEPPNHETNQEYIVHLESFMYDLKVHPERFEHRVAELRAKMAGYAKTEGYDADFDSVII